VIARKGPLTARSLRRANTLQLKEKEIMLSAPFDILKRHHDGSFIWLEAVRDLPTAQSRLQHLCAREPGEYFVFDQASQQIVAKLSNRSSD
jgi:hypothetical protein